MEHPLQCWPLSSLWIVAFNISPWLIELRVAAQVFYNWLISAPQLQSFAGETRVDLILSTLASPFSF